MRALERCLSWCLLSCCALPAWAHTSSLSYLDVRPDGDALALQWSVSLIDLNEVLALDLDGDRDVTWGELRQNEGALAALLAEHVRFQQIGHACSPDRAIALRVDTRQGEPFAVIDATAHCADAIDTAVLRYSFLAERNRQHRVIVTVHPLRAGSETLVLAPTDAGAPLSLGAGSSAWRSLATFVAHGFQHILQGWDHILFVLVLVLSTMVPRAATERMPPLSSRVLALLKLVSVFTIAHSLTLALAALQVFTLPSRVVETGIAASIAVTAVNNVWPLVRPRYEAGLVFAFGLLHGMGFAALLNDLLLSSEHRVLALAGFNIGVELGQLAIVLVAVPPLLLVLAPAGARRRFAPAMSLAAACAGCFWFVQRAF